MKQRLKQCILLLFLVYAFGVQAQTKFQSLNFLYSIQGKQILSGQHNDQKNLDCGSSGSTGPRYWTDQVHNITGKYPALWGGDLLFHGSQQLRWDMTYEAEQQWNAGAVVNIMWHACPPTQGASCNWDGGLLSSLSAAQFAELLTDGSNLNTIWKSRVDEIAVHLQYLKDAGVEVFWRPYHEQNQTAFWWNSQGAQNTQALWRMMHNYMTNVLGLTNLIWVWDVQDLSVNFGNWNPGNQYWDVLALDIYGDGYTNSSYYNDMISVASAANKLIAIGECFNLPSAQHINQFPEYTFFMNWAYGLKKWYAPNCSSTNSDDFIREVYNNPKVITLDEMPGWGNSIAPPNLATNKAVTVSSTEAGNNVASNVNDRNYGTRWSSAYTDNEWVAVDLGYTYLLDSINILWESAYATAYEIQVSPDGNNWTTVQTVNNNTNTSNKIILQQEEANHVRILGVARATQYGYSIYEIEIYGTAKALPYLGTPISIPGIIQAEDYDLGGEGVAYHDISNGNQYNQFRNDDVDIETCGDAGGGYNVGSAQTGEWLAYTVDVTQSDAYDIEVRVATNQDGRIFHLEMNSQSISGVIQVPNTGGWQTYTSIIIPNVQLTSGEKKLQVKYDSEYINVNYVSFSLSTVTGVNENQNFMFHLFPNPVNELLNYSISNGENEQYSLEVYSYLGEMVKAETIDASSGEISLQGLSSGIYVVKLQGRNSVIIREVVVK